MKSNVNKVDRVIRILTGGIILALGLVLKSWWGLLGLIPLVTGLIRWCPLYAILNISSKKD